ncbi:MAG: hypothetical protein LBN03_01315, partial [Bifidobacteriaceae bacterium]|nr:hypothetical protein [Bifidobacteriaceae bacterium]
MVNCIENRSGMSSNQLNSYLNSISTELIKLTNEKIRRQLVISCQNAASQISSIESFLEEKYTTSKNIENYSIAELQNLLSKYNSQINDLEFKKAEKIKKNVEEKIMELSAKFDVTTTEHISSKTVENKREQVHRNQFELDRYKDLI